LFNTFENVSGRELSWFWRSWFFETWKLDQAIDTVTTVGDSVQVVVANEGKTPMPARLTITRIDGKVEHLTVPAEAWLGGDRHQSVRIAREPAVRNIEIDADKDFPDLDRSNQVWPR
jgi:hypothetical protein